MASDLPIRCTCGALQGVLHGITASAGNRLVCYCDDCRAFAYFLGRAGEILDGHGGTEIFQTSPARLAFTAGEDRLACMRLTSRGLLRWYASCCNTPLGNTAVISQLPFVGLIHLCIARDPAQEAALGPIRARVFRRFAQGDPATIPAGASALPLVVLRVAARMLGWKLRGDSRRSPFFDNHTGRPVVPPRVLGDDERAAVYRAAGRATG